MNKLIKRRKRLIEPEVKYYLSQLLQSVQYMHGINVIHRDLKLGNLFLDKQLRIKFRDLGLASKLTSSDEKRKQFVGRRIISRQKSSMATKRNEDILLKLTYGQWA